MRNKSTSLVILGSLLALLSFSSATYACDGWRRVENKFKKYDGVDLTQDQKTKIKTLKERAVAGFSDDHKHGSCDAAHEKTIAKYASEAEGVLTNAQKMELKTGERIMTLETEVAQLRREIQELKAMIKKLLDK